MQLKEVEANKEQQTKPMADTFSQTLGFLQRIA